MISLRGGLVAHHLPSSAWNHAFRLEPDLSSASETPSGLRAIRLEGSTREIQSFGVLTSTTTVEAQIGSWCVLPSSLSYLESGDIISLSKPRTEARVLWRTRSQQNFLLLTERCDNYCLMCSQPPRDRDDHWLLEQAFEVAELLPTDAHNIVLTGGEPTIYGERLLDLVQRIRSRSEACHIHLLTNGRRFADPDFAADFAAASDSNVTAAIPIYGAEQRTHDHVVQAKGAFNETILGLLNLAALRQSVELRIVLHAPTVTVLPELADFVIRNLPFVDHIALMGLELTGLTRLNLKELWIDPYEYRGVLANAAQVLDAAGIHTSIYNLPLCLLEPSVWNLAAQSISDWKNEFLPVCAECEAKPQCAGFFKSADLRQSSHIRALTSVPGAIGTRSPVEHTSHLADAIPVVVRRAAAAANTASVTPTRTSGHRVDGPTGMDRKA